MEIHAVGRMHWVTYLWPGLPRLRVRGSWSALAVAVGFAALLNLALLGSLVYDELLSPGVRTACWTVVALIWGGSAVLCYGWDRRQPSSVGQSQASQHSFEEALAQYLKGNWFEAERLLAALLRSNPRDVEARLMVATLFRHTQRWDEAARQLDQLRLLEDSRRWELEIARERALLAELRAEQEERATENVEDDPSDPVEVGQEAEKAA